MEPFDEPHVIISINCPGDPPARIRTNRATLGRTDLFFWDLDAVPPPGSTIEYNGVSIPSELVPEEQLCQPSDAVKVLDLIEAHMSEMTHVIIHCTAGKSRSAAAAAALHLILNGDDSVIFNNPRYSPNMRVYRMVLNEWYERHPMD